MAVRSIKFRGKLVNSEQWMYGGYYYHKPTDEHRIIAPTLNVESILNDWNVQPESVGQYTGLKDRNGKEIYEGDILSFTDKGGKEYRREVIFHHGCFKLRNLDAKLPDTPMCQHLQFDKLNWEVIGNIHDHDFAPKKKEK